MPDEAIQTGGTTQSSSGTQSQSAQQGSAGAAAASTQAQSSQAGTTNQQATQQNSQAPGRPAYIPEQFWDATASKVKETEFGEHFTAMQTRIAADDVRRNSLPASPDAYKAELPADFKLPEGITFKLDESNPAFTEARKHAHEMGLDQQQFSKLLSTYAGAKVHEQTTFVAARNAEIAKLGAAGQARVDAVVQWLTAMDGSTDKGDSKAIAGSLWTARHVEALENIIKKFSGQGGGSFNNSRRDGEQTPAGRKSAEEIGRMSPAQRLDYNRQFDQSTMPAWHDPRPA